MKDSSWKFFVITIAQVCCYFVMIVPLRLLALARRDIDHNIARLQAGSLVVANHQSPLDPFIVLAHMPFLAFLELLPIRFPVTHGYMSKKRWQALRLVGAYDIGVTPREKMMGLYRARQYLRHEVTIFLFPEGKVNRTGQVGELQRGLQFLMAENTPLMFVRLQGFHYRGLKFLFKPRVIVFSVPRISQKVNPHDIEEFLRLPTPEF